MNPISKVTTIPHGSGDPVHLMEVGVNPEERKGGGRERNLTNQAEDVTVSLTDQLPVQRQIKLPRTEVLQESTNDKTELRTRLYLNRRSFFGIHFCH